MGQITTGTVAINIGDVAVDGGPGTALDTIGFTDADATNEYTEEESTFTDWPVLESDTPIYTTEVPGAKTLNFTVIDPDVVALQKVLGGELTGTAPNQTWNEPLKRVSKEQTVELVPEIGLTMVIPRGRVSGRINRDLSKTTGKLALIVSVRVMQPTKTGVGPLQMVPTV